MAEGHGLFSKKNRQLAAENQELSMRVAALEAAKPVTKPLPPLPKRSHQTAVRVWKLLNQHFDEEELSLLAFEFGVDDEQIKGETKLSKAKAFVEHVWRRGELQGLILLAQDKRPNIEWPVVPKK